MRSWDEFVSFVRGTRERPPPGPKRPLATALLVLATLLHLPLVYLLIADGSVVAAVPIFVGLLAMGLAWSGGVSLEGRRQGTVRILAGLGVAEGALALVPSVAAALDGARWLFVGIAVLCAATWMTPPPARRISRPS